MLACAQLVADAEAKLNEMQMGAVSRSVQDAAAAAARNVTGVFLACIFPCLGSMLLGWMSRTC